MKKWDAQRAKEELERQGKQRVQRRKRIMNQIELAFVKKGKDAVNFVTCDKCDAMAKFLGLAFENPGATVIDPDQITGAWCEEHDNRHRHQHPFKTKKTGKPAASRSIARLSVSDSPQNSRRCA